MKTKKKSDKNLRKSGRTQEKIREFNGIKKWEPCTYSPIPWMRSKIVFFIVRSSSKHQCDKPVQTIITARKRSLRRLCFYRCLSTPGGRGACVVLFREGMRGFIREVHGFIRGEHAWFYSGGHVWFYSRGMHGFIGGCAWFYLGGMCGFIRGACMVLFGGACVVFSVFSDTMRYGQWAGGTHPTGMHSCHWFIFWMIVWMITYKGRCIEDLRKIKGLIKVRKARDPFIPNSI